MIVSSSSAGALPPAVAVSAATREQLLENVRLAQQELMAFDQELEKEKTAEEEKEKEKEKEMRGKKVESWRP